MLPLQFVAAAEDSDALDHENYGDEQEIPSLKVPREPAKKDDCGPDECKCPKATGRLLQYCKTESEDRQLLFRSLNCATSPSYWGWIIWFRTRHEERVPPGVQGAAASYRRLDDLQPDACSSSF